VLLTLLRVGVAIGMRVVLPVALTLLSLLFGRSLVRAAREVRAAGRRTGNMLKDAQGRIRPGRHRHGEDEWRAAPPRSAEPPRAPSPPARPAEAAAPQRTTAEPRQRIDVPAEAPAPSPGDTTELADAIDEVEQAVRDANSDIRARRGP